MSPAPAINRFVPLRRLVAHLSSLGFHCKMYIVFLHDQNDIQKGEWLGTMIHEAFYSVTSPVGKTEAAGESPFMDASWRKKPSGLSIPCCLVPTPDLLQTPRTCCVSSVQLITKQTQTFLGSPRRAQKCKVSSCLELLGGIFLSRGNQRGLGEK